MSNDDKQWHVVKEVPLAMILVLIVQTAGVIWWASSITSKVEASEKATIASSIVQTSVDRRQDDEQMRAEARVIVQLDRLNAKIDRLLDKSK